MSASIIPALGAIGSFLLGLLITVAAGVAVFALAMIAAAIGDIADHLASLRRIAERDESQRLANANAAGRN
jgi:hypothetical protein